MFFPFSHKVCNLHQYIYVKFYYTYLPLQTNTMITQNYLNKWIFFTYICYFVVFFTLTSIDCLVGDQKIDRGIYCVCALVNILETKCTLLRRLGHIGFITGNRCVPSWIGKLTSGEFKHHFLIQTNHWRTFWLVW